MDNAAVAILQEEYDAMQEEKSRIRRDVRDKYKGVIRDEIKLKSEELEKVFARKLKAAKEAGMKRFEIAEAIRTNDGRKMRRFMDLAGIDGFQRGRPSEDVGALMREQVGCEIVDAGKMRVRVFEMAGVPVEEYEGVMMRQQGIARIEPVRGDIPEDSMKIYREDRERVQAWLERVMEFLEA